MVKAGWATCTGVFLLGVVLGGPGLILLLFTIMAISALALTRIGIGGSRIIGIAGLLFASTLVFLTVELSYVTQYYRESLTRATADVLADSVKDYWTEYGSVPTGSHAEIIRALRGDNPRKIVFYAPHGVLNAAGERLDPLGNPYRFDLSDPNHPRIYSFGKNQRDDGGVVGSDDICSSN
jgi:hypothetical protein